MPFLRLGGDLADGGGKSHVADKSLVNHPYVYAYYVSLQQLAAAGDAVDHFLIDRGAYALGIPVVSQERCFGVLFLDPAVSEIIQG